MKDARHYTCMLLEKIDAGILDPQAVVESFCSFCSESDVHKMMQSEGYINDSCSSCGEEDELNEDGMCEECVYERTCNDCGDVMDSPDDLTDGYCGICADTNE